MVAVSPTSQVPTWAGLSADEVEDLDEPPELKQKFQRLTVRRPHDQASLLTRGLMGEPEESSTASTHPVLLNSQRRRSMTSNVSIPSTADLTSDTGLTSPCRTNTPSPPIPEMMGLRLQTDLNENARIPPAPLQAPKKRCIQFACAKPPVALAEPMVKTPSAEHHPTRPSIKFACPARPASTQNTPPKHVSQPALRPPISTGAEPTSSLKEVPTVSTAVQTPLRSPEARRPITKTMASRPKFLRANSKDLVSDCSQFHEFASGTAREDDWIRQPPPVVARRLTIDDTLSKENHFRRLGAEAEAEAEMEEQEEEEDEEEVDDDDEDEENVNGEDDEHDENAGNSDVDDVEGRGAEYEEDLDGYHTDSETGFAESDDDDEEDENMMLWTPSHATARRTVTVAPIRRPTIGEAHLSDSSEVSHASPASIRRSKIRRIKIESETPDLPDSTDFVCGTLDEDRPLEEAYLSCLAARRSEKFRVIPQDIDPSFPASDLDNDDGEEIYNPVRHDSDEDVWVQGKMEDIHHGQQDRSRRRKKSEQASPRKYRSPAPAPRRHHSPPPPKARGHSPKQQSGRSSPKRIRSPALNALDAPFQTPRQGHHIQLPLAGRPGVTMAKSLPRPPAIFTAMKANKPTKHQHDSDCHLRGAIDIVKGLERKRSRRKDKFFQKYCNRARRGQIPERKPLPGRGAERMKELGLLMAGKKDQGNYVLSI